MGNPTVHFRPLGNFVPAGWLAEQFNSAQALFQAEAGLLLQIGSDNLLPFGQGQVNVTQCSLQGGATQNQQDLFASAADVPATDIVVFIVQDTFPWKGGGCAWHPIGKLGCMVTAGLVGKDKWKLAHEIGHVLGLFHQDFPAMLMFGSVDWSKRPPHLTQPEINFLNGNGSAPIPRGDPSLALSDDSVNRELRKIEPDYRRLTKYGSKAAPLLKRYYESAKEYEYKARALYALSLVSPEIDDILISAAKSPAPELRRAVADAAGRLLPRATPKKVLAELLNDPDPSVQYVANWYATKWTEEGAAPAPETSKPARKRRPKRPASKKRKKSPPKRPARKKSKKSPPRR